MTATRRRFWPVILLGTLSLVAGYAWGRFRPAPTEGPESTPIRASDALVDNEREMVLEVREVPPATVDTAPPEIDPPTEDLESSPPDAKLDEVADLVESLANATPEEIARFPWDRHVRAALDKLRASGAGAHPVDSSLPPGVLADLLSKLLERANLPLTEAQHAELEQLATDWETHIDRQLADLGDDALALERELSVVSATDDFLEEVTALLDGLQMTQLDSWTPETLEWPPLLSPLTSAPIARREFKIEEIPGLRDDLSRSLARDFGLDPEDGDRYAANFLADVERLLALPSHRSEIVERAVALGEAQARLYRQLLAHPAIDAAARRRIQARRRWLVPVFAGE